MLQDPGWGEIDAVLYPEGNSIPIIWMVEVELLDTIKVYVGVIVPSCVHGYLFDRDNFGRIINLANAK